MPVFPKKERGVIGKPPEVRARIELAHNCFVPEVRFRLRRNTTSGSRTSRPNAVEAWRGIEPLQ